MVSLNESEMDKVYKHEAILDHKEMMIQSLRDKMREMQLSIDLAEAKEKGLMVLPHHVPSLVSLSPTDRKRHENALGRDETFAKYAALARHKKAEREKVRIRLQELSAEREKEIAWLEHKKIEAKKESEKRKRERKAKKMEEERVKERQKEEEIKQRRQEYEEKLEAGRHAKRIVVEKKKAEVKDVREMRMIEKKHHIARAEAQKRGQSEMQGGKDLEYMELMKQFQELEKTFKTMKHKDNYLTF
jgi:hypothetical protein